MSFNLKTPCYVFDIEELISRATYLKTKLTNIELCYAVKANTFIVKELDNIINRFEVCSPGEEYILESLNIDKSKMVISGVNKNYDFIDYLIKNDGKKCIYTIESINQLNLLLELSNKYQVKLNVLIRFSSNNQFGVSEKEVLYIIKNYQSSFYIKGIQYYSGTQKNSIKKYQKEFALLINLINKIKDEYDFNIEELEYGPGFPVTYFKGDKIDESVLFDAINDIFSTLKKDIKLIFEIGRSLVSSSGSYYTKIIDIKKNDDYKYAIVDGGINQLVYFGQMMAMKLPYYDLIPNRQVSNDNFYTICGSLCTTNDILIKQLNVLDLEIGDIIQFKNTGAYSITEGMSLFLSRELPCVYFKKNNNYVLVRDFINTYKFNMIIKGGLNYGRVIRNINKY